MASVVCSQQVRITMIIDNGDGAFLILFEKIRREVLKALDKAHSNGKSNGIIELDCNSLIKFLNEVEERECFNTQTLLIEQEQKIEELGEESYNKSCSINELLIRIEQLKKELANAKKVIHENA